MSEYDARRDAFESYNVAIAANRARLLAKRCPAARRVEVIGHCELYLGDSIDIVKHLRKPIGALVCDPPYGIGFVHGGNDGVGPNNRYATKFADITVIGDDKPFDPRPWLKASSQAILWGANHYCDKLPPAAAWLVWDKRAASWHSNDHADCEMAWTNLAGPARVFRHNWDGFAKASERGVARVHPTQKAVALMEWCIDKLDSDLTIFDPFMGSGSTGVACIRHSRRFIGIEISEEYFEIACDRIRNAYQQLDLFHEPAVPHQEVLL